MTRRLTLAFCFLFFAVSYAIGAAKYAAPPLGIAKCIVAFDMGYPSTAKNKSGNWDISVKGKYNYDNAWTFKKLEVYLTYTSAGGSRNGPSWTVTDESTLGTPGAFNVAFLDTPPPMAGEVLVVIARITVSQAGQADQANSVAGNVPIPPNGGNCGEPDETLDQNEVPKEKTSGER